MNKSMICITIFAGASLYLSAVVKLCTVFPTGLDGKYFIVKFDIYQYSKSVREVGKSSVGLAVEVGIVWPAEKKESTSVVCSLL